MTHYFQFCVSCFVILILILFTFSPYFFEKGVHFLEIIFYKNQRPMPAALDNYQLTSDAFFLQLFKKLFTLAIWNQGIFISMKNQKGRIIFVNV
jgi:hypothetical protein